MNISFFVASFLLGFIVGVIFIISIILFIVDKESKKNGEETRVSKQSSDNNNQSN